MQGLDNYNNTITYWKPIVNRRCVGTLQVISCKSFQLPYNAGITTLSLKNWRTEAQDIQKCSLSSMAVSGKPEIYLSSVYYK